MSTKYIYSKTIYNNYLGIIKEIKGQTWAEVELKTQEQIKKWRDIEAKRRERERLDDMKSQAEYDTKEALIIIEQYKEILKLTIGSNYRFDWDLLKDKKRFKKFIFEEKTPNLEEIKKEIGVPIEDKFLEFFFDSKKRKRLKKEEEAINLYNEKVDIYNKRYDDAKELYNQEKENFIKTQQKYNESIEQFKQNFEDGHGDEIERYVHMILERSWYPEGLETEYEIQYDPFCNAVIVSFELPDEKSVPRIIQHKYIAARKVIESIEMKPKVFNAYYEDILYQLCLSTIYKVFRSVYINDVKLVIFNGWISGVDPKTGNDFRSCIMSCQVQREEFENINFERIDPKECFRYFKGLSAGPLSQLAPVIPIMDIKRSDSRFIESREVLAEINSTTNLATMDWADFEHLVRELFSEVFSKEDCEVNVTQASRDGGVDAIAFDPDPIRGGKFVIQAKRYNNVVPVSAVRDLFGTMIAEGATKGILVTTSYYGNDSREFAKGRPITLIDGANLIYMFQEYGHNVSISLQKKQKKSVI